VAKEKHEYIQHITSCHQQTKVKHSYRHNCTNS